MQEQCVVRFMAGRSSCLLHLSQVCYLFCRDLSHWYAPYLCVIPSAFQAWVEALSCRASAAQRCFCLVQQTGTATRSVDCHPDAERGNLTDALHSEMIPCHDYTAVCFWPQDGAMSIIASWSCSARFWSGAESRDSCWRHGSSWNTLTEGI